MLDFTVHVQGDPAKIDQILKEITKMLVELEDLRTKVTELENASEAAVNLLTLIKQKLDQVLADATDFAELKAGVTEVSSRIGQEKEDLAAAVVENTPAE